MTGFSSTRRKKKSWDLIIFATRGKQTDNTARKINEAERFGIIPTLNVCLFVCLVGWFACLFVCLFLGGHSLA